jgi:hypothetical protein
MTPEDFDVSEEDARKQFENFLLEYPKMYSAQESHSRFQTFWENLKVNYSRAHLSKLIFRESNSTATSSKAAPNTASQNSPICPITNSVAIIWDSSPSSRIQIEKSTKKSRKIHRKS